MSASKMFNTELRAEAERWPDQYHADIHYMTGAASTGQLPSLRVPPRSSDKSALHRSHNA